MLNAFPTSFEKPRHSAICAERLEKFNTTIAQGKEGYFQHSVIQCVDSFELETQNITINMYRLIKILDRDSDVIDCLNQSAFQPSKDVLRRQSFVIRVSQHHVCSC